MNPAFKKFLDDNTKGAVNKVFLGASIAEIATADNKLKALAKTLKDMATFRLAAGGGLAGSLAALGKGIRDLVKDTGSLDAALKRISAIQGLQRTFAPLVGGAEAARKKVAELVQLGAKTPFRFETWGAAAKTLEVMTRGAYASTQTLLAVGNAAAATGNGLSETADAVAEVHAALREGRPIAGAAEALREMGIVTAQDAQLLNTLAETGAGNTAVFGQLTAALEKHRGGMASLAGDVEAVNEAYAKAKENFAAAVGAPFTDEEVQNTANLTAALNALAPAAGNLASFFEKLTGGFSTAMSGFARWVSESPKLVSLFGNSAKALGLFAAALSGLGVMLIPAAVASVNALITALVAMLPATVAANGAVVALSAALRGLVAVSGYGVAGIALVALAGAVVNLYDSLDDATEATNKAVNASLQHANALRAEMDAAQSVTEKHAARLKILQALAAAYETLARAKPGSGEWMGAQSTIRKLNRQLSQDKGDATLAPDAAAQKHAMEEAARSRKMEDEYYSSAMEKATPEERLRLMGEYRGVLENRRSRADLGAQAGVSVGEQTRAGEDAVARAQSKLSDLRSSDLTGQLIPFAERDLAKAQANLAAVGSTAPQDSSAFAESMRRRIGYYLAGDTNRAGGITGTPADMERWRQFAEQRRADEENRTQLDSQISGLASGEEVAKRELEMAQRRQNIEARISSLKSTGVDRAREEQRLREAYLSREIALAAKRSDTGLATTLSSELSDLQTSGRERERGVAVGREEIQRGLAVSRAELGGDSRTAIRLSDFDVFARSLESLRGQLPEGEARKYALAQAQQSIAQLGFEAERTGVVDSMQRIGGGGGVSQDPMLDIAQRQLEMQQSARDYLQRIDAALNGSGTADRDPYEE